MAENKIRVSFDNLYIIEVNDNGDTIEFNLDDPEMPLRYQRALEKMQKIQQNVKAEAFLIEKKSDNDPEYGLSIKQKEMLELYTKTFRDMRNAMDSFLGNGACQKIFGDRNSLTMFDQLFDQLEPHFQAMGLKSEKILKSIAEKYGDTEDDVLS